MHKGHFTACAVGIALAVGFLVFTGGSAGGLGLLVAALACPIAMVVAMRFLMGDQHTNGHAQGNESAGSEAARNESATTPAVDIQRT